MSRTAYSLPVAMPSPPGGPATGVAVTAKIPSAKAMHAQGADPMSSKTFQRAGAVPVLSATCTVASAMPTPKQPAYAGNHNGWMNTLSLPNPMASAHATVTGTSSRHIRAVCCGRQVLPSAAAAMNGNSR